MPLLSRPNNFFKSIILPQVEEGRSFYLASSEKPLRYPSAYGLRHRYNSNPDLSRETEFYEKTFYQEEDIFLPQETSPQNRFDEILNQRGSHRDFSGGPITLQQFSKILAGAKFRQSNGRARKAIPSAGARYPLELYLLVRSVEGLVPGLYSYAPSQHSLQLVKKGEELLSLAKKAMPAESRFIDTCSFVAFITALPIRTTQKYQTKGWRFVYFETGFLGQTLLLSAENQNVAAYVTASGIESEMKDFLGLAWPHEVYLLGLIFGSK